MEFDQRDFMGHIIYFGVARGYTKCFGVGNLRGVLVLVILVVLVVLVVLVMLVVIVVIVLVILNWGMTSFRLGPALDDRLKIKTRHR